MPSLIMYAGNKDNIRLSCTYNVFDGNTIRMFELPCNPQLMHFANNIYNRSASSAFEHACIICFEGSIWTATRAAVWNCISTLVVDAEVLEVHVVRDDISPGLQRVGAKGSCQRDSYRCKRSSYCCSSWLRAPLAPFFNLSPMPVFPLGGLGASTFTGSDLGRWGVVLEEDFFARFLDLRGSRLRLWS